MLIWQSWSWKSMEIKNRNPESQGVPKSDFWYTKHPYHSDTSPIFTILYVKIHKSITSKVHLGPSDNDSRGRAPLRKRYGTGAIGAMGEQWYECQSWQSWQSWFLIITATHYSHLRLYDQWIGSFDEIHWLCTYVSRISSDHPMCLLHTDLAELRLQALWTWHQITSFPNLVTRASQPPRLLWNNMAKDCQSQMQ